MGIRYVSMHWQLGRSLLDSVMPEPAAHPGVRAWYLETSADLLRMRQSAAAVEHYARARQLFPSDPEILFGSGVLHEMFALDVASGGCRVGHRIEPHVGRGELGARRARQGGAVLPRLADPSAGPSSRRASGTGACSTIWDDTKRRAEELRRAIADGASDHLLYLAQLFLGRAEEARGHDEAARAAFERASALYPNAQSPRLALSQIARRAGNRAAAQRELQRDCGTASMTSGSREDPWWLYYHVR